MDAPVEGMKRGTVYRASQVKRMVLLSLLVALYAIVLPFCYNTAGEPRKAAALSAQEKADEKWEAYGNFTDLPKVEKEDKSKFAKVEIEDDAWGDETSNIAEGFQAPNSTAKAKAKAGWLAGWFGPTKEQKRVQQEQEDMIKVFNEKSEEGPMALPPTYLPSAWACLALLSTLSLHALFFLMCYWQKSFKAAMLYTTAEQVTDETSVLIVPPDNRGTAEFVAIKKSAHTDALQVEFQRQTYLYTSASKLGGASKKFPNGLFRLSTCPIDKALSFYTESKGLTQENEVERTLERWGKNQTSIQTPSFFNLLQSQLLSPLAIFQVFCALLWLLDEYWTYTMWTLVSVVVMEATTVFQRTRTQKMLGGMAPPPTPIYVYRCGKWMLLTTKDLLPGDMISLAYKQHVTKKVEALANASPASNAAAGAAPLEVKVVNTTTDAVIPCDCLLLRGAAVVNESSLTGESVPQMKESLQRSAADVARAQVSQEEETRLDMQGNHRVNVLFSGTSLVTVESGIDGPSDAPNSTNDVADTPDGGAVAYVLRTGFSSSQGTLIQMIEFSQQSVAGDLKETGLALFILLLFALAAAAYVLKEGLIKKEKTTHELLLKCVIIITSVVPRQFPMQMAMAVNMALMALMKGGIFCTEPFRVPLAGKITHCLFDKTGTLTTDQLVPVGVVNEDSRIHERTDVPPISKVHEASHEAAMILAACHSLVEVADEAKGGETTLQGDPIEIAAIKGIQWHWDSTTSSAKPGSYKGMERALQSMNNRILELNKLINSPPPPNPLNPAPPKAELENQMKTLSEQGNKLKDKISDAKAKANLMPFSSIKIAHRHHFSSALQRMSVVAKCKNSAEHGGQEEWFSLVKGSPEAIYKLFAKGSAPAWYVKTYENLARRGLRVLALAYRPIEDRGFDEAAATNSPREWVEKDLLFGGFIAFECKIRADSGIVMKSLIESDHKVSMLTGDGLLTSLHVARETYICREKTKMLTLHAPEDGKHKNGYWAVEKDDENDENSNAAETVAYDVSAIESLAEKYDLVCTEADFLAVIEVSGGDKSPLWTQCGHFRVFARMSPHGKASIIRNIQDIENKTQENYVLMCGDGGNDVGALKQADIGMALLAGHANANTTDKPIEESAETAVVASDKGSNAGKSAEDALNAHQNALKKRSDEVNKLRTAHMKKFQAAYTKDSQARLQEKIKELTDKGDYGGMWGVMKGQAGEMKAVMAKEGARFMAMHGQVWDPKKHGEDGEGGADGGMFGSMMEGMGDMDEGSAGGLPMVRPGDASVAAPFTSRTPSVRSVVDLIRQGRCTLLSALMQQQIMMLESIIAAYTLSALSLHNARSSERQMMASSWLIMTAAVAFSYASPLDHMHPLRPLKSLFHPAIFISVLGQAAIHIACMSFAVSLATEAMGEEGLAEVTEFFKKAKAKEITAADQCDEDDMMCNLQAFWAAPFLPNLLNTTVFLVETSQMISVFFANYKGRPWMKGILENHALFLSVFLCVGGVVVASWEMVPQLNEIIQLAPFPDDTFRYKVVALVLATIVGTFLWDRLCTILFAPKIAKAMIKEITSTKPKDLVPVLMTFGKVAVGIGVLGTGNLLMAGGAYWWYSRQKKAE